MVFHRILTYSRRAFWIGAAVIGTIFILLAVQAVGPAGGLVIKQLTRQRKLPLAINVAPEATTICGILLYWRLTGGVNVMFHSSL